jgi:hypothetical protein
LVQESMFGCVFRVILVLNISEHMFTCIAHIHYCTTNYVCIDAEPIYIRSPYDTKND